MDSSDLFEPEPAADRRSASDLATLLVELGRVVKGRAFYGPRHPTLALLFRRGYRAWQGDLKRHGALELEIGPTGFWSSRPRSAVTRRELGGLAAECCARGLRRVRFEPEIDAEALAAFVELLASDRTVIEAHGGFEHALYARVPAGIVVNGAPPKLDTKKREPAERAPVESQAAAAVPNRVGGKEAPSPARDPGPARAHPEATGRPRAREPRRTPVAPERRGKQKRAEPPLEGPTPDARKAEAADLLSELDDCEDCARYAQIAGRLARIAEQLSQEGHRDESYRVILELARHAGDDAKRPAGQAELAAERLSSLVEGERLQDLIGRACEAGTPTSLQAAQILLQLGQGAVPALLAAAEREPDPLRRGQLHGILIAMGGKTLPALLEAMEGCEPDRARSAIRIAGESRIPGAVSRLAEILVGENDALREEASKALARIGDPSALEALSSVLSSDIDGLPALAAHCLAASASPRAVGPLLRAMHEAIQSGEIECAHEAIRALGRLARPEAARALAELLLRKSILKRRRLRELKVAAASALGRIPGDEAVGALAQAARSRDGQLRRAAQTALDRRAQALSGA